MTFQTLPLVCKIPHRGPTTPRPHRYSHGLGSSPFARHYWGNHCLFSLPGGTKMFQFPPFASRISRIPALWQVGCPIRKSADQGSFAPTRGLSQLITSFIASVSQGIRPAPLITFSCNCCSTSQTTIPLRLADRNGRDAAHTFSCVVRFATLPNIKGQGHPFSTVLSVAICQRSHRRLMSRLYSYILKTVFVSTRSKDKEACAPSRCLSYVRPGTITC